MMVWKILLCILFGYLVGCINPAYIIGRLRGFDIRKQGSGNAGASNAVITMGKAVGIFSGLFDILKAAGVFWLAPLIFGDLPLASEIAGVCCVLGHIFPVFMKFKGGKGTAAFGGLVLAIDVRLFFILLALEIGLVILTDYLCTLPITVSILVPILYGVFGDGGLGWLLFARGGWWGAAVLAVATLVILQRNILNLRRIRQGTEMHVSYLWRRDKNAEIDRIQKNGEKEDPPSTSDKGDHT